MKTFIIEEHDEAFYVWHYAIKQKILPKQGNTLFHVDEHSDMETPRFNESIHQLNGNLSTVMEFTRKELGISNFIFPAVYQGVFDKIYWMRLKQLRGNDKLEMFVRSYNDEGRKLISGKLSNLTEEIANELPNHFEYHKIEGDRFADVKNDKSIALDIDLDYFSCSGDPNQLEEIYINITEEEYDKFNTDPYNRLNFSGVGRIETVKDQGKFYYMINFFEEIYPTKLKVDTAIIEQRIVNFIEGLKANEIEPKMITICRSRYSGYTPDDQWGFIESTLLKYLSECYKLELHYLADIQ